jgi:UDP-N-acetyl-2-amino-2-deoxyglucuronate dehydrogenase
MKNFALIGAAGYIAPRHLKAIKDTGNVLVASLDKFDSVGVMDSYFPSADFFTEFERFDRHIEKLKRKGTKIDYVSICTPNYLHDSHIRFGLRHGADVICEKPLVINPWNLNALKEIEQETGKKIYTILQLRLHPSVIELKKKIENSPAGKVFDVDLAYITSRGNWYYTSWKGNINKSGGIATNIGVHFFDMLAWVFGKLKKNEVHLHTHDRAGGYLEFEKANVRWFLSINSDTLPEATIKAGLGTYRAINIGDETFEFSGGFTDLHTQSYENILAGKGFGIDESMEAIKLVHDIRIMEPRGLVSDSHPLCRLPLTKHPFER